MYYYAFSFQFAYARNLILQHHLEYMDNFQCVCDYPEKINPWDFRHGQTFIDGGLVYHVNYFQHFLSETVVFQHLSEASKLLILKNREGENYNKTFQGLDEERPPSVDKESQSETLKKRQTSPIEYHVKRRKPLLLI